MTQESILVLNLVMLQNRINSTLWCISMNRREVPLPDPGFVPTKHAIERIPSQNRCRGLSHRPLVSDLGQWDRRTSLNGDLRQLLVARN